VAASRDHTSSGVRREVHTAANDEGEAFPGELAKALVASPGQTQARDRGRVDSARGRVACVVPRVAEQRPIHGAALFRHWAKPWRRVPMRLRTKDGERYERN